MSTVSRETVKGLVLTGYGMNCDYESAYALELCGFKAERVHINQLSSGEVSLADYRLLVVGGGFAWADDHGAGVLLAHRLKSGVARELKAFLDDGNLVIGICNGFQALVNLGLLPGFDDEWDREVALLANDCGNFRDDWVGLAFNPDCPSVFTTGLETMDMPVRHGEGKLWASPETIARLEADNLVAARYCLPDGSPARGAFPANPNGSLNDIAAICDPTGRVLGLMPHPECYNHLTNHPQWAARTDVIRRLGLEVNWRGEGLALFENAHRYLTEQA